MSAIPKEQLKLLKPSPIFYSEINGLGQPTLNDLQRIEKILVGSCQVAPPDLQSFFRSKLPIVYEPLTIPVGSTIDSCIANCFIKQFTGFGEIETIGTMVGTGFVPKPYVNIPWDKKSSYFTTPLSVAEHHVKAYKIPLKKRRFTPTLIMFKTGKPVYAKTLLRFIGRWIPVLGWVLLASDIYQISFCIQKCIQENKNKSFSQS